MIDGKLQEFVSNGIARGQISFGDVRRLQRGCLPSGIRNREEVEALIALNAKLLRADKTWAEWLIGAVADFVAKREGCEQIEDAAGQWVELLLTASAPATNLGRRIARQIRRELARLRAVQSTSAGQSLPVGVRNGDVAEPPPTGAPETISTIVRSEIMVGRLSADIPRSPACAALLGKTRKRARELPQPATSASPRRRRRPATAARTKGTKEQAHTQAEQGAG